MTYSGQNTAKEERSTIAILSILEDDKLSSTDIKKITGFSSRTVWKRSRKLTERQLIKKDKEGKYSLTEKGRIELQGLKETNKFRSFVPSKYITFDSKKNDSNLVTDFPVVTGSAFWKSENPLPNENIEEKLTELTSGLEQIFGNNRAQLIISYEPDSKQKK